MNMDDTALIKRFVRDSSTEVFRELVELHTNFVCSCAMQRLHDAHAAQYVTQSVFLTLALKAKELHTETTLPGWLYRATQYSCAMYQRGEQRRKERERISIDEHQFNQTGSSMAAWEEILPYLAGGARLLVGL